MNFDTKELEYILKIYDEKSITKAAKHLYISQPSLSQIVKKVEKEIDAQIFDRSRTGIQITDAGQELIRAANQIMLTLQQLQVNLDKLSNMDMGTISFGMTYLLGHSLMPNAITTFMNDNPGITLKITSLSSTLMEEMLKNNELDIAILPMPIANPKLQYIKLHECDMVLLMGRNNPYNKYAYYKNDGDAYKWLDLRNVCNAVFYENDEKRHMRNAVSKVEEELGLTLHIETPTNNIEMLKLLVSYQNSMMIIPDIYVRQYDIDENGSFNRYYIENLYNFKWTTCIAYKDKELLSPCSKKLLQAIIAYFRDQPQRG